MLAVNWGRINALLLLLVLLALLAVIALLATRTEGGELDPEEPPGSTMKSLDEIPGAWSQRLPSDDGATGPDPPAGCGSTRFQCVFDDWVVLDRETGLVWTRYAPPYAFTDTWVSAQLQCRTNTGVGQPQFGGVLGWRLPTVEELQTVIEPTAASPALPAGHPFVNTQPALYWTSTTYEGDTAQAYVINLGTGQTGFQPKTSFLNIWCVRGAPVAE